MVYVFIPVIFYLKYQNTVRDKFKIAFSGADFALSYFK